LLTLGPHSFFWFTLEAPPAADAAVPAPEAAVPTVRVSGPCAQLLQPEGRDRLTALVANYVKDRRWFGGKARTIRAAGIPEVVRLPFGSDGAYLVSLAISYTEGGPETYVLPLAVATGEEALRVQRDLPLTVLSPLRGEDGDGVLYEVMGENDFCQALLDAIVRRRRFKGAAGELVCAPARVLRRLREPLDGASHAAPLKAEQSNTSIVYGEQLILKVFRRVDEGVNPELEISRFLTERAAFAHTAPLAGAVEYRPRRGEVRTVAVLHGFVPNEGDAWRYTLDTLGRYCETALAQPPATQPSVPPSHVLTLMEEEPPDLARQMIGPYSESARLLGERTAEMHIALASDPTDPLFAPEPFSTLYQRSIYQSMRSSAIQSFQLLRQRLKHLSETVAAEARQVLGLEDETFRRFHRLLQHKMTATRTRYHGDFHLGQVLYTGKDFVIIDFEGEPGRPLSERQIKRSPLRDVAGMLRSFHYAASAALFDQINKGLGDSHARAAASLEPWLRLWQAWVSATFLRAYFAKAGQHAFVPPNRTDLQILLDAFVLEKAVYEIRYELNNRPGWVHIPLRGVVQLLAPAA
jgi:maltose alpha-D-glucosyltransferase / alpha-amylase